MCHTVSQHQTVVLVKRGGEATCTQMLRKGYYIQQIALHTLDTHQRLPPLILRQSTLLQLKAQLLHTLGVA